MHKAREQMKSEEIDSQHEIGSDLYLKVTPVSTALIKQYDFKKNVTKFVDAINHELWYEIPFANTDWWEAKGCPCGRLQV